MKLKSINTAAIKQFIKTPVGIFVCCIVIVTILSIIAIRSFSHSSTEEVAKQFQQTQPQAIDAHTQYTTREVLDSLTGKTENLEKSLDTVQQQFDALKSQQDTTNQQALDDIHQELDALKAENEKLQEEKTTISSHKETDSYTVGGDSNNSVHWIDDSAPLKTAQSTTPPKSVGVESVLQSDSTAQKSIAVYTIPANTLLTGVTPEQPLVGVIPTDGTVINPETVMFMVGEKNLAANNWQLPENLKGIQGNALCQGVFNFDHSAVRCDITSLTFIFSDGRIATETADKNQPYGQLTTLYGNPYIPGKYYGNAAYAAGGSALIGFAKGFGEAFAASQVQTTSTYGTSTFTQFNNANQYAMGQGIGSGMDYFGKWWDALMKSTTNYVFVPNWNPDTKQILILNAKITQQVDINYNSQGRKVNNETQNTFTHASLD